MDLLVPIYGVTLNSITVLATDRAELMSASASGVETSADSRAMLKIVNTVKNPQLVYAGINNGGAYNAGTATVTAYLIDPKGNIHPVSFGGSASGTVPIGGILDSDSVKGLTMKVGETWYVETRVTGNWAKGKNTILLNGERTVLSDATPRAGTAGAAGDTYLGNAPDATNYIYSPLVVGTPVGTTKDVWGVFGDSISVGVSDATTTLMGYWSRTFSAIGVPMVNLASNGDNAQSFSLAFKTRLGMASKCGVTKAIYAYGWNDASVYDANTTAETLRALQQRALRFWRLATDMGMTCYIQTCTPKPAASTNAKAAITQYNQWCRLAGTASPGTNLFADCIDVSIIISSAIDSNVFNTTGGTQTGDSIHPNALGNTNISSGIGIKTATLAGVSWASIIGIGDTGITIGYNPLLIGINVDYKLSSSSTWLPLGAAFIGNGTATINGLTASSVYDIRIRNTDNVGQVSAYSTFNTNTRAAAFAGTSQLELKLNGNTTDTSGNSVTVTVTGSLTYTNDGVRGQVANLATGIDLRAPISTVGSFTWMAWIKPTTVGTSQYSTVMAAYNTFGSTPYNLWWAENQGQGGRLTYWGTAARPDQHRDVIQLSQGAWQHVALIYDSNQGLATFMKNGKVTDVCRTTTDYDVVAFTNLVVGEHPQFGGSSAKVPLVSYARCFGSALSVDFVAGFFANEMLGF